MGFLLACLVDHVQGDGVGPGFGHVTWAPRDGLLAARREEREIWDGAGMDGISCRPKQRRKKERKKERKKPTNPRPCMAPPLISRLLSRFLAGNAEKCVRDGR